MRIAKRLLTSFIGIVLLYIGIVLVHGTFNDYQPEAVIPLEATQNADSTIISDSILTFTTWNLGYGGLGAEADFFYDDGGFFFSGSSMVRPPRELSEKYIAGSADFVKTNPSDFFLFQEVDVHSKRSYFINQFEKIGANLPKYAALLAPNYNTPRVPLPLLEPWKAYGQVYSGVATYAKYEPTKCHALPIAGAFCVSHAFVSIGPLYFITTL